VIIYLTLNQGHPGADAIKVKGNIHWLSCKYAVNAKVNLYDRLFKEAHPGENNNYLDDLNPNSLTSKEIKIEENLKKFHLVININLNVMVILLLMTYQNLKILF